jgi:hypothetical protein
MPRYACPNCARIIFLSKGAPVPMHQCRGRAISLYDFDDSEPTNPQIRLPNKP